jgi:hypothetical protein
MRNYTLAEASKMAKVTPQKFLRLASVFCVRPAAYLNHSPLFEIYQIRKLKDYAEPYFKCCQPGRKFRP